MPLYRCISTILAVAALVSAHPGQNETSLEWPSRDHPRDLLVKRGRDCGTWTLYCGGLPPTGSGNRGTPAPMACANACFYINIYSAEFTAVYSDSTNNNKNRQQSGCQKNLGSSEGTSVCNIAPFSQKFHDQLEEQPEDPTFQCDEFPMADMEQLNFDAENVPRNTLRCINGPDNAAAGAQLGSFVAGTGWYSQDESLNGGRSNACSGPLQNGDTYKVAFNYGGNDDFDKTKIPFCLDGSGDPLMPKDKWDNYNEFYLTKLPADGTTGRIDFPYQPTSDNTYADGLTGTDTLQCSVVVYRTGNADFEADITYGDGSTAQGTATLSNDGDSFTVTPPDSNQYQPLKIRRTAALGTGDGTPVEFFYALGAPGINFAWSSNQVGADDTLNAQRPDGIPSFVGRYCLWTQVGGDPASQTITCYFPCNSPLTKLT